MIRRMTGELLHRLLFTCHHQFSWPRRTEDGDYYQLCVHCGTKYRYDWARMRRVSRIGDEEILAEANRKGPHKCGNASGWTPRERRLRHRVPVLFRINGSEEWLEGATDNVSRSGLLFRGECVLDVGTSLELVFEMPRELSGQNAARVFCRGSVVRVVPAAEVRKRKQSFLIACSIDDSEFIAEPQQAAG
ncbi:MAG TPA: PilZ domain-containing protein [Terriglobales bacterium]|jgi:hypothetical protein|nr:PilZ domain-containing protein [Terriglobales bacterium]